MMALESLILAVVFGNLPLRRHPRRRRVINVRVSITTVSGQIEDPLFGRRGVAVSSGS